MRAGQVSQTAMMNEKNNRGDRRHSTSRNSGLGEQYSAGFAAALQAQFDLWHDQVSAHEFCQTSDARHRLAAMKANAHSLLATPISPSEDPPKSRFSTAQSEPTQAAKSPQSSYDLAERRISSAASTAAASDASDVSEEARCLPSTEVGQKEKPKSSSTAEKGLSSSARAPKHKSTKHDGRKMSTLPTAHLIPAYMILDDSPFRLVWDVALMLLIFYYAEAVPVRMAFNIEPQSEMAENFFTLLFIIDIFLNFNTTIYIKGLRVHSRKRIALNYLFGPGKWFWIDLAASFPFDWVIPTPSNGDTSSGSANKMGRLVKIFRLLRIAKMLRLLKLGRIMGRFRQVLQVSPGMTTLAKTLGIMLATWHWSACGYWAIATNFDCAPWYGSETEEAYWCPPESILEDDDFQLKYAFAFFWGISATTGAGYEVLPNNRAQIAYSALIIIIGSALYCNILASMTSIIQGFGAGSAKKNEQLETIFAYLKREPTTKSLRNQIRAYYDFMWTDGLGEEVSDLIRDLPESIQMDIATKMNGAVLENIAMFRGMHSAATYYLVQNWQRLYVVKGDKVIEQGDYTQDLYIVFRGRLSIKTKLLGFISMGVRELNDYDHFGECGLISNVPVQSNCTVTAMDTCEILLLSQKLYNAMRAKFELEEIHSMVQSYARKTQARIAWKKAIAKVIYINRFQVSSSSSNSSQSFQPHRRQSLMDIMLGRSTKGAPKKNLAIITGSPAGMTTRTRRIIPEEASATPSQRAPMMQRLRQSLGGNPVAEKQEAADSVANLEAEAAALGITIETVQ